MTEYQPTHAALEVQPLSQHPVTDNQRALLLTLGLEGELLRLGDNGTSIYGRYRLDQVTRSSYLRVLERSAEDKIRATEPIVAHLLEQQADIIAPIPFRSTEQCLVLKADWFEGRYLPCTPAALKKLGSALARLHQQLGQLPPALTQVIASRTQRREARLREHHDEIRRGQCRGAHEPDLTALFRRHPAVLELPESSSQPLHGDLNRGNVLTDDDRLMFIDFEDSPHSFLPVIVELAFAVERFALLPSQDLDTAETNALALLNSYRESTGLQLPAPELLGQALCWHSLRSLTLLSELCQQGVQIPASEWRKFLRLLEWQQAHTGLLKRLGSTLT